MLGLNIINDYNAPLLSCSESEAALLCFSIKVISVDIRKYWITNVYGGIDGYDGKGIKFNGFIENMWRIRLDQHIMEYCSVLTIW